MKELNEFLCLFSHSWKGWLEELGLLSLVDPLTRSFSLKHFSFYRETERENNAADYKFICFLVKKRWEDFINSRISPFQRFTGKHPDKHLIDIYSGNLDISRVIARFPTARFHLVVLGLLSLKPSHNKKTVLNLKATFY